MKKSFISTCMIAFFMLSVIISTSFVVPGLGKNAITSRMIDSRIMNSAKIQYTKEFSNDIKATSLTATHTVINTWPCQGATINNIYLNGFPMVASPAFPLFCSGPTTRGGWLQYAGNLQISITNTTGVAGLIDVYGVAEYSQIGFLQSGLYDIPYVSNVVLPLTIIVSPMY